MAHWHRLDTDFGKALSHDVCLQRTFRFAMKLEKDVGRPGGSAVHRTPAGGRKNDIPPSAPSAQVSNGRFEWLARMSACGPSRQFAAAQQFGRFRSEADIYRAALQNQIFMSTRPR
jgi:hypothetical protein